MSLNRPIDERRDGRPHRHVRIQLCLVLLATAACLVPVDVPRRSEPDAGMSVPDASVCDGDACDAGVPCGPATCDGCCDATGACVVGTALTACGSDGGVCASCSGACVSGQCQTCGPANCTGCCRNGVCEPGSQNDACGKNGASCSSCVGNQFCERAQCLHLDGCNPGACPSGCCRTDVAFGLCTQASATFCGASGGPCLACRPGETCLSGLCRSADGGDDRFSECARTCAGCCDQGANCRAGTARETCGSAGSLCRSCSPCDPLPDAGGRCR